MAGESGLNGGRMKLAEYPADPKTPASVRVFLEAALADPAHAELYAREAEQGKLAGDGMKVVRFFRGRKS
jgi:hypothetical protein